MKQQMILDAKVKKIMAELEMLEPLTNEYWDKEEELRNAEIDADGYAEDNK